MKLKPTLIYFVLSLVIITIFSLDFRINGYLVSGYTVWFMFPVLGILLNHLFRRYFTYKNIFTTFKTTSSISILPFVLGTIVSFPLIILDQRRDGLEFYSSDFWLEPQFYLNILMALVASTIFGIIISSVATLLVFVQHKIEQKKTASLPAQ